MSESTVTLIRIVLAVPFFGFAAVILRARFLRKDRQLHHLAIHWTLSGLAMLLVEILIRPSISLVDTSITGLLGAVYGVITTVAWQGSKRYERAYRDR